MDDLEEKHFDTKRGMTYRYYLSKPSPTLDVSKPLLVLFHGWPDGAALWQFMIPRLQKALPNHAILAPDLLGYGETSKPTTPSDYTATLLTQDILGIISHENLSHLRFLPIGHDWGSHTSQRFHLLHPDLCVGLINLSVAYMIPNRDEPLQLSALNEAMTKIYGYPNFAYWELFTSPEGPALLDSRLESLWVAMHGQGEGWMKTNFCAPGAMKRYLEDDRGRGPDARELKDYARVGGGLRERWLEMMGKGGMTAPLCWYRVFCENLDMETERSLPKSIEKPYLFVGSRGDDACRFEGVQMPLQKGLLEDATVKQLEGGHWIPYERPDEVCDIMVTWMNEKGFA